MATEYRLATQLRALADLVERTEDALDVEVQAARPAGIDPDGESLQADLTVATSIDGRGDPAPEPADTAAETNSAEQTPETDAVTDESDAAEPGSGEETPALSELTDTVRKDVIAVAKHGQEPHKRADDRDVTPAAIHHNLRVARDQLGVDDLDAALRTGATDTESGDTPITTPADGAAAADPAPDDEEPEWAATDGGAATAQTGASVTCQNCGNTVTRDYARVFSPEGVDGVRACPECPDIIREGDGSIRQKRSGPNAFSAEEVGDGDA